MSAAEILVGAGGQSGDVAGEAGGEPCEPQAGGQGDRRGGGDGRGARRVYADARLAFPGGAARRCCVHATSLPGLRARASERSRGGGGQRAAAGAAVAAFQAHGEATGFLLPYSPAVSGVRASVLVRLRRACSPLIAVCFARSLGGCAARRLLRFDDDRLSGGGMASLTWSVDELGQLVSNLAQCLPANDLVKYTTMVEKVDWEKVRFGSYTAAQCKEKWAQLMQKLRRYRTLTDLVGDAREWLKRPWLPGNGTARRQRHPGLPKKPLTPYFRFFLEKREKYSRENPELSMTELAKLISNKFQELPEKKKVGGCGCRQVPSFN
ncbi:hypothetical protein MTO96_022000 [Rhipicephalus appendiculatus]